MTICEEHAGGHHHHPECGIHQTGDCTECCHTTDCVDNYLNHTPWKLPATTTTTTTTTTTPAPKLVNCVRCEKGLPNHEIPECLQVHFDVYGVCEMVFQHGHLISSYGNYAHSCHNRQVRRCEDHAYASTCTYCCEDDHCLSNAISNATRLLTTSTTTTTTTTTATPTTDPSQNQVTCLSCDENWEGEEFPACINHLIYGHGACQVTFRNGHLATSYIQAETNCHEQQAAHSNCEHQQPPKNCIYCCKDDGCLHQAIANAMLALPPATTTTTTPVPTTTTTVATTTTTTPAPTTTTTVATTTTTTPAPTTTTTVATTTTTTPAPTTTTTVATTTTTTTPAPTTTTTVATTTTTTPAPTTTTTFATTTTTTPAPTTTTTEATTTTASTTALGCHDEDAHCADLTQSFPCGSSATIDYLCAETCNICGITTTTTTEPTTTTTTTTTPAPTTTTTKATTTTASTTPLGCHDEDDHCLDLTQSFPCGSSPVINNLCAETCNMCDTTTIDTTTTIAATATSAGVITSTAAPITSTVTTTSAAVTTIQTTSGTSNVTPLSCVQCGDYDNKVPCTSMELLFDSPSPCTGAGASFCMTDVVSDASSQVSTYKRCVNQYTCNNDWYILTSGKPECLNFDPVAAFPSVVCHYCCVADACNVGTVPDPSVQWLPS